jgi:hypothetical protein
MGSGQIDDGAVLLDATGDWCKSRLHRPCATGAYRVQPSKPVTVTFSYRTYMYHRNIANQEEGFHVATFVDHTACIHTLFTDGSPGFLPLYASKIHELIRGLTDRSQVLLPPRFHLLPEQSCYCRSCAAGSARLR